MWSAVPVTSVRGKFSSPGNTTKTDFTSKLNDHFPATRFKHAACVAEDGHIYVHGGRSGNVPLGDLWRFDPSQNQWELLEGNDRDVEADSGPPYLQQHTMLEWNGKLFVFGGEVAKSRSPLWIFDIKQLVWKQLDDILAKELGTLESGPAGRIGHTACLYGEAMHVYGGFIEFSGSSSELWAFDLKTCKWHLMSSASTTSGSNIPPGRHSHSGVVVEDELIIYGGLKELHTKSDCWKWNFITKTWSRVKTNKGPGSVHSHAAIGTSDGMLLFGGQRDGVSLHELWSLNLQSGTWQRIRTEGAIPAARCWHVAMINPTLITSGSENVTPEHKMPAASKSGYQLGNGKKKRKTIKRRNSFWFGQESSLTHDQQNSGPPKSNSLFSFSGLCRKSSSSDSDYGDEDIDLYEENQTTRAESNQLIGESSQSSDLLTNDEEDEVDDDLVTIRGLKSRIQKSISSDAVLRCRSTVPTHQSQHKEHNAIVNPEVNNQQQVAANSAVVRRRLPRSRVVRSRPRSEVIQSLGITPEQDDEYNWIPDPELSKRHSVHQSMSYYSLCFPSPHFLPKQNKSLDTGDKDKTSDEERSSTKGPPECLRLEFTSNKSRLTRPQGVLLSDDEQLPQTMSTFKPLTDTSLTLASNNQTKQFNNQPTSRNNPQQQRHCDTDVTPSCSSGGMPPCMSHSSSSGYNSFADQSLVESTSVYQQHNHFPVVNQSQQFTHCHANHGCRRRTHSTQQGSCVAAQLNHQSIMTETIENGASTSFQKWRENRTRSLPRSISNYNSAITPVASHHLNHLHHLHLHEHLALQPLTKEPLQSYLEGNKSKWTYSPTKQFPDPIKTHNVKINVSIRQSNKSRRRKKKKNEAHDWLLCMYVLGGRESCRSTQRTPLSIWKLYI